jgi:hypothetical protein
MLKLMLDGRILKRYSLLGNKQGERKAKSVFPR